MKSLVTVTIQTSSHNDLKQAEKILASAIEDARMRINSGAKIKRSFTNADDPQAMMALMGQLKWWTLGKSMPNGKQIQTKKKGWFSQLVSEVGKQAKEIYNMNLEDEM